MRGRWVSCRLAFRPGVEWLAAGQGAVELFLPLPALWQMQDEATCRAGEPSDEEKKRRLSVLVVTVCSLRPIRAAPVAQYLGAIDNPQH